MSLKETAYSNRPEVKGIQIALEREGIAKSLANQSLYARLRDRYLHAHKYRGRAVDMGGDFCPSRAACIFGNPNRARLRRRKPTSERSRGKYSTVENSISLEVEQAYREAVTARNQIELFETDILTQAEEVYNMFLFSYQEGEIGGIELIAARRTLMEARRSYADALTGYSVALAAVQKAIGQGLGGELTMKSKTTRVMLTLALAGVARADAEIARQSERPVHVGSKRGVRRSGSGQGRGQGTRPGSRRQGRGQAPRTESP